MCSSTRCVASRVFRINCEVNCVGFTFNPSATVMRCSAADGFLTVSMPARDSDSLILVATVRLGISLLYRSIGIEPSLTPFTT